MALTAIDWFPGAEVRLRYAMQILACDNAAQLVLNWTGMRCRDVEDFSCI